MRQYVEIDPDVECQQGSTDGHVLVGVDEEETGICTSCERTYES